MKIHNYNAIYVKYRASEVDKRDGAERAFPY